MSLADRPVEQLKSTFEVDDNHMLQRIKSGFVTVAQPTFAEQMAIFVKWIAFVSPFDSFSFPFDESYALDFKSPRHESENGKTNGYSKEYFHAFPPILS